MQGENKVTRDHDEIRKWAQDRGGRPVELKRDRINPNASTLQIDFLYEKYDDNLTVLSWDNFFEKFDADDLALVYQTETEDGKLSRFSRIVHRNEIPQAVIE